ncbi:hypothetical protein SLEP1_g28880 [Rubroshorea leprosula]|uniref:Uncharacterized protein n=1 Tax=Rubroshorea leprosula TaxID=152421 RepID=A0AAV5K4Q8_9ROSI|nr:hypothetical protein SLEP1_g28880 [Rubroshorea leprosula]
MPSALDLLQVQAISKAKECLVSSTLLFIKPSHARPGGEPDIHPDLKRRVQQIEAVGVSKRRGAIPTDAREERKRSSCSRKSSSGCGSNRQEKLESDLHQKIHQQVHATFSSIRL